MRKVMLKIPDAVSSGHYLQIEQFTQMLKKSKTLTFAQKNTLWKQARDGDLEGARCEYAKLVTVRGRDLRDAE